MVRHIKDLTGYSKEKYGVTICLDGWDIVQSQQCSESCSVWTMGKVFLGTINTRGHYKDHDYLASQIRRFVEQIRPQHVVQVCTKNATNMLSSTWVLKQQYLYGYVQGCASIAWISYLRLEKGGLDEVGSEKDKTYLLMD